MLENLTRLAENVKGLDADLVLFQIFSDPQFQEFIKVLNLSDQLFEGIDSLGVELDSYSAFTQNLLDGDRENAFNFEGKTKKKIAGEPIFLFDTGEFYDSFTVTIDTESIILDADGVKEDGTDLFVNYGEDILGLTDENLQKLINKTHEAIVPIILEQITEGI